MMMTTCWNCGARLSGPTCQMCGAVQAPQAGQPSGPAGQPVVSQASMSVRPPSGAHPYAPEGRPGYGPDGQSGLGAYAQRDPYQQSGMPGSDFYQRPPISGYAMPGERRYVPGGQPQDIPPPPLWEPQAFAPASAPVIETPSGWSEALSVPLALLGGLATGVVGAAIWAFILDSTHHYFTYLAFLLGIVVGFGVALGARGHHDIELSLFAGALSLFVYFLALYFRLSLAESHILGESANLFALSLDDFVNGLGDYLVANLINFLNFVLVPMAAMGTAYKYINRGRR